MLGGVAPILFFTFPVIPKGPTFNALSGIPFAQDFISSVGVPIPIYLSETLTGIFVESESRSIDLEVDVKARADGRTPEVKQNAIDNVVNVNLVARRDSLILNVLLAMSDLIFTKAAERGAYSVSYLNQSTAIFDAKIKSFSTSVNADNNLLNITLGISKANFRAPAAPSDIPVLSHTTGVTP